jgi:hypothetical protein
MNEELTRIVEPETIKMKAMQRIISLFMSPGELMQNIKAYPVILVPFLVSVVIGLLTIVPAVSVSELETQEMNNIFIERFPDAEVNPFDFAAMAGEYGEIDIGRVMSIATAVMFGVSAFATPFIMCFIATLIIFVVCKILKGKAKFVQIFSMYMHIYVIIALGTLVIYFLMSATGNYINMTSLAPVFMPNGNISMPMYNTLSGINIFSVWVALLTFVGLKNLNEFSSVKAGVIVGADFVVTLALTIGMTAGSIWIMGLGVA